MLVDTAQMLVCVLLGHVANTVTSCLKNFLETLMAVCDGKLGAFTAELRKKLWAFFRCSVYCNIIFKRDFKP